MNRVPLAALSVIAAALSLAFLPPPAAAADPAASAPASTPKPKKRSSKPAEPPKPPPEVTPPQASVEQMQAVTRVLMGDYACEFSQTIQVQRSNRYEGYVNVAYGKDRWVMKPVISPIGAVRLEDVGGKTLMVQIAYKSMLLDTQRGQRLVDDCVHDEQARLKRDADKAAADATAVSAAAGATTPAAATPVTAQPAASAP
jgi:hypothetical protein